MSRHTAAQQHEESRVLQRSVRLLEREGEAGEDPKAHGRCAAYRSKTDSASYREENIKRVPLPDALAKRRKGKYGMVEGD